MLRPSNQSALAHFILMRFNVRSKHAAEPRDAAIRDRAHWLETRFDLFEAICWPTLAAQTSKNFELHVYFDRQTPLSFIERFDRITSGSTFVQKILCDFFDAEIAVAAIKNRLSSNASSILTTRLDNDDGLHNDFVATLQREAGTGGREAINFSEGLILTDQAIYASSQRSNAFISVIEEAISFETVLQLSHNEIAKRFNIRNVVTQPMWLQNVHGGNVSNKIRGRRLTHRFVPNGFEALELASRIRPIGRGHAILENLTFGFARSSRDMLAKLLRRFGLR